MTPEENLELIDDCEKRDHLLSAWDADFLASIRSWLESHGTLSEKQESKLGEIWEKATRRG